MHFTLQYYSWEVHSHFESLCFIVIRLFSPSGSSQDLLPSQLSDSPQRCVFNMSLFSTIMLGLRWLSNVKTHVHYFYKFFLYSFTDDSFFLCSLFLVLLLFKHCNSWDGMGWSESSVSSLHTSLNSPFFSMIPGFQLFLVPIPLLFSPETTTYLLYKPPIFCQVRDGAINQLPRKSEGKKSGDLTAS